jgi:hypothetical protein
MVLAFSVTRIMVRSAMAVALPSKDAGRCHRYVAAIMIIMIVPWQWHCLVRTLVAVIHMSPRS